MMTCIARKNLSGNVEVQTEQAKKRDSLDLEFWFFIYYLNGICNTEDTAINVLSQILSQTLNELSAGIL